MAARTLLTTLTLGLFSELSVIDWGFCPIAPRSIIADTKKMPSTISEVSKPPTLYMANVMMYAIITLIAIFGIFFIGLYPGSARLLSLLFTN